MTDYAPPPATPASLPPGQLPPRRRVGKPLVVVLVLAVVSIVLVFTIGTNKEESGKSPGFVIPQLSPEPGTVVPRAPVPAPEDRPNASDVDALNAWAQRISATTKISPRVLAGYGRAEMWLRSSRPSCRLSWATLAGIGWVESQHGQFGGAQVETDGQVSKPIIGPALDGSPGVQAIKDTDDGRLDGDTVWDRAVGPMQMLPETWRRSAAQADSAAAVTDPQNIDDAALAAGQYLCSGSADLSAPNGWWRAVLTYNQSVSYGRDVYSAAEAYAAAGSA